jgi:hypothetical protein
LLECLRGITLPILLAKKLTTAPIDTLTGIVSGIGTISSCLVRGIWEVATLSGDEFSQSPTAQILNRISSKINSMSYDEKIEESIALATELFFPVAFAKLKIFERSKRFISSLRKVVKKEQVVKKALKAEKASSLARKAGTPVGEAFGEAILETRFVVALKKLNANDRHHILQEKHDWWKVVPDPSNWGASVESGWQGFKKRG